MAAIMRSNPHSIRLDGVSVCYRAPNERVSTFKEYAIRWLQGRIRHDLFWALREVDLEVGKGEALRRYRAERGRQEHAAQSDRARAASHPRTRPGARAGGAAAGAGRGVSPRIERAREHHPQWGHVRLQTHRDGRQSRAGSSNFPRLENFIDAPMRTYSSGMWARLGFAVATDVDPDILILDEVLSVGDEAFQRKCLARIETFRQRGVTILLVSHNTALVEADVPECRLAGPRAGQGSRAGQAGG